MGITMNPTMQARIWDSPPIAVMIRPITMKTPMIAATATSKLINISKTPFFSRFCNGRTEIIVGLQGQFNDVPCSFDGHII